MMTTTTKVAGMAWTQAHCHLFRCFLLCHFLCQCLYRRLCRCPCRRLSRCPEQAYSGCVGGDSVRCYQNGSSVLPAHSPRMYEPVLRAPSPLLVVNTTTTTRLQLQCLPQHRQKQRQRQQRLLRALVLDRKSTAQTAPTTRGARAAP